MVKTLFLLLTALIFLFFSGLASAQITPGGSCNASVQPYGCNHNGLYYCPNATWQLLDNCTSYSPMRYCDYSPTAGACVASPVVKPGSYCTSGTGCYNNEYLTCVGNQWNETQNCTATNQSCSLSGCVGAGQEIPGSSCNASVKPFMCYQNGLYSCPGSIWLLYDNCTAYSPTRYCSYGASAGSCVASPQNIPGSWCSAGTMCYQNKLYSCQLGYWGLQEDCQGGGKYCGLGACYSTPQSTPGAYCNPNITAFTCFSNDLYYCPAGVWILYQSCSASGLYCQASNTSGTCAPSPPFNITPTTYPVEPIPIVNATEWTEAGFGWALFLLTKEFIASIIIMIIAAGMAYIGGERAGMVLGGGTAVLLVLIATIFGVFPWWIGIVFIIIASGIVVFFFKRTVS